MNLLIQSLQVQAQNKVYTQRSIFTNRKLSDEYDLNVSENQDKIIDILNKLNKNENEYEYIWQVLKSVIFLQEIKDRGNDQISKDIINSLRIMQVKKGKMLVQQDQEMDCCYFLIKGQLSALVNDQDFLTQQTMNYLQLELHQQYIINQVEQISEGYQKNLKKLFNNLSYIAEIKLGQPIGNLKYGSNKIIKCNIFARQDSVLITLHRSNFNKIMDQINHIELKKYMEFLMKFYFFNGISQQKIHQMFGKFEKQIYSLNEVIYDVGQIPQFIYLIEKGEVEFLKVFDEKNTQEYSVMKKQIPKELKVLNKDWCKEKGSQINLRCRILSQGECFGDREVFLNEKYQLKAVCVTSPVEIIKVPKQIILDYFNTKAKQFDNDIISYAQNCTKIDEEILLKKQEIKTQQMNKQQQIIQLIQKKKSAEIICDQSIDSINSQQKPFSQNRAKFVRKITNKVQVTNNNSSNQHKIEKLNLGNLVEQFGDLDVKLKNNPQKCKMAIIALKNHNQKLKDEGELQNKLRQQMIDPMLKDLKYQISMGYEYIEKKKCNQQELQNDLEQFLLYKKMKIDQILVNKFKKTDNIQIKRCKNTPQLVSHFQLKSHLKTKSNFYKTGGEELEILEKIQRESQMFMQNIEQIKNLTQNYYYNKQSHLVNTKNYRSLSAKK